MKNRPYNRMPYAELAALPVQEYAKPDSMLVLWSTWTHLNQAMELIPAWGFRYCAGFPWLKVTKDGRPIFGLGVWFQGCTELILVGRRGKPFGSKGNPRPARKGIVISRRQEHSRKPDEVAEWIERCLPGPYLELFARRRRPGWDAVGDQLPDH